MPLVGVRPQLVGDRSDGRCPTGDRGYTLAVSDQDLDARAFDKLVAGGRQDLARGQLEAGVSRLSEALELWRGPPLSDVPASPTVLTAAARLQCARLGAYELRFDALLDLGRHAEVVDELQRLVVEHPLRERLRAQLMVALDRSDRRAEALDAYRQARTVLVDELGLEPGAQLAALATGDPRRRGAVGCDERRVVVLGPAEREVLLAAVRLMR